MQKPEFRFDTKAIDKARSMMRFLVVLDESQVESMFPRLDEAINHALEIVPFKYKPVHIYSTRHGDCLLTVWPRDVKGDDLHGQIHKA